MTKKFDITKESFEFKRKPAKQIKKDMQDWHNAQDPEPIVHEGIRITQKRGDKDV